MEGKRYILVELSQAKDLLTVVRYGDQASPEQDESAQALLTRIENEIGADLVGIAAELKGMKICHACAIEGQEQYCKSLLAKKMGRRLFRLIKRADSNDLYEAQP